MNGKSYKQRVIDNYLNATGRNQFVPREFLDYLRSNPDHECYALFFGTSDADAAQAYREQQVRSWVSGLRVVVRIDKDAAQSIGAIAVSEYTLPALHSPWIGRKSGGGYEQTDPQDRSHLSEMARQGAVSLTTWLERYAGAANLLGVDTHPIKKMIAALEAASKRAVAIKDAAA